MSEIKKITQEQLDSIVENQKKSNNLLLDIGFLEYRKQELLLASKDLSEKLKNIKEELESQYGQVNINLSDGTYTEVEKENEDEPVLKSVLTTKMMRCIIL
jgi:hypothetical protein